MSAWETVDRLRDLIRERLDLLNKIKDQAGTGDELDYDAVTVIQGDMRTKRAKIFELAHEIECVEIVLDLLRVPEVDAELEARVALAETFRDSLGGPMTNGATE